MLVLQKLNSKSVFALIAAWIALVVLTLVLDASYVLMITLMLWVFVLIYSCQDISDNIALFCFLISFYVFLLGREVAFNFFGLERYYLYLVPYNNIAFGCLQLSLVGILIGDTLWRNVHKSNTNRTFPISNYSSDMQKVSRNVFYFCYLFQVAAVVLTARYVSDVGYLASYTNAFSGPGVPSIVSYIAGFSTVAFCLYLSTQPDMKDARIPMALYELYGLLTLLTGQRFPFIAVNMLLLIYIIIRYRSDKRWFSKRIGIALIIIIPILMILLSVIGSIRLNQTFNVSSVFNALLVFFDSQGGSINNINRVLHFKDQLTDLHFTSFESTRAVLTENIIMRNLFDVKVYEGNSYEHAIFGHSLSHRLSYLTYYDGYLQGMGVGSCYIAELLHDFKYAGVLIGNIIYGYLLRAISQINFSYFIRDGLLLAIVFYLILAPRGGFDSFVGGVFSLYSLLGILVMYLVAKSLNKKHVSKV